MSISGLNEHDSFETNKGKREISLSYAIKKIRLLRMNSQKIALK
jgi:hypothetical protein